MESLEPKRCLTCGYILDHLPEPRCPECGRAFNLANRTTYFTSSRSGRNDVWLAIAGLMVAGSALVGLDSGAGRGSRWGTVGLLAAAVAGFAVEAVGLIRSQAALNAPRGTFRRRRAFLVARAISFLTTLAVAYCFVQLLCSRGNMRLQK